LNRESGNYHGTANPNGQENPHQTVAQSKAMDQQSTNQGLRFRSSLAAQRRDRIGNIQDWDDHAASHDRLPEAVFRQLRIAKATINPSKFLWRKASVIHPVWTAPRLKYSLSF